MSERVERPSFMLIFRGENMNKYGIAYYDQYADIKTATLRAESIEEATAKAYTHPDVCELDDIWLIED